MKVKLEIGPRFGSTYHVPRHSPEIDLLIGLGFVSVVEETQGAGSTPIPSRGWGIARVGLELKPCLIWNDGVGGSFKFLDVPAGVRNIPDPPAELVARFNALRGNPTARAEAEARQLQEARRAAEQAKHPGMKLI